MTHSISLIERLPLVRGSLKIEANLASITWFRVGGPAEIMFKPVDLEDLTNFLTATPKDIPIVVIGGGSNILVRDAGVPGIIICLGCNFSNVKFDYNYLTVGASTLNLTVATTALNAGICDLEFLSDIPGTIGGALRMNAGSYGYEMKNITISARAIDRTGTLHYIDNSDFGFSYRHTTIPDDWILIDAVLHGHIKNQLEISKNMAKIRSRRKDSQPPRTRTGGSTFVNPKNHKAWKLIDQAGCRGLRKGGAQVSEKHCNFLINTGVANATDIEDLGEDVRCRVFEKSGIMLDWEIRRIGIRLSK
ncbi:MAG: UDP-N-acetylmuramate dehydrogenase [Rhodospirillaceae bacterium]|nr:UDP-N-acetylmuramate dehydrogenase [Rhodospirillaceae bacterium]